MEVVVSSSCVFSAFPSFSCAYSDPLWSCFHGWQSSLMGFFTWFAVPQKLFILWALSLGCGHSRTDWSNTGSSWGRKSCQDQQWLPTGPHSPSGHTNVPQCGIVHGLKADICSTVDQHGLQGDNYFSMVFTMGCRGISASVLGPASPFVSSLTSVSFASCTYSHFSLPDAAAWLFYPFLHMLLWTSYQYCHFVQQWVLSWRVLELAPSNTVADSGFLLQKPPLQATLLCKPNAILRIKFHLRQKIIPQNRKPAKQMTIRLGKLGKNGGGKSTEKDVP